MTCSHGAAALRSAFMPNQPAYAAGHVLAALLTVLQLVLLVCFSAAPGTADSPALALLIISLLLPLQFVHVLFCLQVYLLSPFVRRYVRSASLTAHILLTAGMVAAALLLLMPLSGVLSLLYMLVILSVSFVCPYWLVHIQKFKAKINGPWDEAVPRIPTSIHSRS